MKLIHTKNYEAMSKEAADLLLDTLRKKPDAVICLATGSSPARMYELRVCYDMSPKPNATIEWE